MKTVTMAMLCLVVSALCLASDALRAQSKISVTPVVSTRERTDFPVLRHYDRDHLAKIALPLGGIGTGTVSLGRRDTRYPSGDWDHNIPRP